MNMLPRKIFVFILIYIAFITLSSLLIIPSQLNAPVNAVALISSSKPFAIHTTPVITSTAPYTLLLPFVSNYYRYRELIFVSDRNARIEDLYRVKSDGSELENLTNTPERSEWDPKWSPDGTKIAFASHIIGDYGIYIIDSDGSNMTRLTENLVWGSLLNWSYDSTKIVFDSLLEGQYEIYTLNAGDGSQMRNLSIHPSRDQFPYWSPDGTQVVFWSERDGNGEVYVVNIDGTELTNLTNNDHSDVISYHATPWSPDGTVLLFSSYRDNNWEIYVVRRDGTDLINLTESPGSDNSPIWSPNGAEIAFIFGNDDQRGFAIMNADGTGKKILYSVPASVTGFSQPTWSPDGSQIAFTLLYESQGEVYVINRDGSGLRNISNHPSSDFSPVWRP